MFGAAPPSNFSNLFQGQTSGATPSGADIQKIWDEINDLKSQRANVSYSNSLSSSWAPRRSGGASPPDPLIDLTAKVSRFETDLDDFRAEMNESAIDVGSTRFTSRSEAVAWFNKYLGKNPELIVCFADVHALMAMATDDADSIADDLKMRVDLRRAGHGSPDQASFSTSFGLELPLQFGTPSQCGADLRVLPKCKKFEDFDTSVYATSFRQRVLDQIRTTSDRLQALTRGREDVEYVSGDML